MLRLIKPAYETNHMIHSIKPVAPDCSLLVLRLPTVYYLFSNYRQEHREKRSLPLTTEENYLYRATEPEATPSLRGEYSKNCNTENDNTRNPEEYLYTTWSGLRVLQHHGGFGVLWDSQH